MLDVTFIKTMRKRAGWGSRRKKGIRREGEDKEEGKKTKARNFSHEVAIFGCLYCCRSQEKERKNTVKQLM